MREYFSISRAFDREIKFSEKKITVFIFSGMLLAAVCCLILVFFVFMLPGIRYNWSARICSVMPEKAYSIISDVPESYADTSSLKIYISAICDINNKNGSAAIEKLLSLGEYRNSKDYLGQAYFILGNELAENGEYDAAAEMFSISDSKNSSERLNEVLYKAALSNADNGNFEKAISYLAKVGDYSDAATLRLSYYYSLAINYSVDGDAIKAAETFETLNSLGGYNDSLIRGHKAWYELAVSSASGGDYVSAGDYIIKAVDYPDVETVSKLSEEYSNNIIYDEAVALMNNKKYVDAIALFDCIEDFRDSDVLNAQCESLAYSWTFDGFLSTDGTEETKTTKFKSSDLIYIRGTLDGGKPGKNVNLVFTWVDCKRRSSSCVVSGWCNNTNGGCYFSYTHPKNADSGQSTMTVSIEQTGEVIATFKFNISV